MAFDWREYLDLARFLQSQASSHFTQEAGLRSAVSRTYYAAYGHALRYASDYLGFVPRRPEDRAQDHGRLRAHLKRRRRGQVADTLSDLRDWRNECDYADDLPDIDISARAAQAVTAAEYVINSLAPPVTGP